MVSTKEGITPTFIHSRVKSNSRFKNCLINEQDCIIRFKSSTRSRESLNMIIHDCEFF